MFLGGRWGHKLISVAITALGIGLLAGTLLAWGGFMLLISLALIIFGVWLMCDC